MSTLLWEVAIAERAHETLSHDKLNIAADTIDEALELARSICAKEYRAKNKKPLMDVHAIRCIGEVHS